MVEGCIQPHSTSSIDALSTVLSDEMLVFTVAALLAYAFVVSADIVNTEWAAWASRGSNDDLMKFVTVRTGLVLPSARTPSQLI